MSRSRPRSQRGSIDSDIVSVSDNMSLMEDAQLHIAELLDKLESSNMSSEAAEASYMINSMESMLGTFSDNMLGMQNEMSDILESSRKGQLTHEKLTEMLGAEQIRTNFVVNIVSSLKVQIESLFSALQEMEDENGFSRATSRHSARPPTSDQSLTSIMSRKMNLMLKSVDSLSQLVKTPTKKVQKTITTIDSEVVIHASKLAGMQPTDMAFKDYTRQSFSTPAPVSPKPKKQKPMPEKTQVDMEKELGITPSNTNIVKLPEKEPSAPEQPEPIENSASAVIQPRITEVEPIKSPKKDEDDWGTSSTPIYKPKKKKEKLPVPQPLPKIDIKHVEMSPTVTITDTAQEPNEAMNDLKKDLDEINNDLDDVQSQVSLDSALATEVVDEVAPTSSDNNTNKQSTDSKKKKKAQPKSRSRNVTPRRNAPVSDSASVGSTASDAKSATSQAKPSVENTALPPPGNKRSGRRPSFDFEKERAKLEKSNAAQLGAIAEATAANLLRASELEKKYKLYEEKEKALSKRNKELEDEIQRRVSLALSAEQKQLELKRRELEIAMQKADIAVAASKLPQYSGVSPRNNEQNEQQKQPKTKDFIPKQNSQPNDVVRESPSPVEAESKPFPSNNAVPSGNVVPGSKMDESIIVNNSAMEPIEKLDSKSLQLNSNVEPVLGTTTSVTADVIAEDTSAVVNSPILEIDDSVAMDNQSLASATESYSKQETEIINNYKRGNDEGRNPGAAQTDLPTIITSSAKDDSVDAPTSVTNVSELLDNLPATTPGGTQLRNITDRKGSTKIDPVEMINTIFANVKDNEEKLDLIRINAPYHPTFADRGTCTRLDGIESEPSNLNDLSNAVTHNYSNHVITGLSGYGSNSNEGLPLPDGVYGKSLIPGNGKEPNTSIQEHIDGQYQIAKEDIRKSYDVAKAIMRRSFDQDTYNFMKEKLEESAVEGKLGPRADEGGLFELPVYFDGRNLPPAKRIAVTEKFHTEDDDNADVRSSQQNKDDNLQGILVARTYKPQPQPSSFIDALGQSDFPLHLISEEYAAFLPRIHKVRLQASALMEDRISIMLPQSNAARQLISSLLESIVRVSTDCDKMLRMLDGSENTIANLIAIVKANPNSLPMINISVQMSDLYSNFGSIEAGKITIDLEMFEFRSLFERINAQGMKELHTLMQESSDFEYCYKYFVACQGKSVEINQRLSNCRERCLRYKLIRNPDLKRHYGSNFDATFSDTDGSSLGMGGKTPLSANEANDTGNNSVNNALRQEVMILQKQVADLQENVETLQEDLEDAEVEMLELMKEKDRAPDALTFFALMHDPSYVQNLQQLSVQLRALKSFVDGSAHMDFVTLRKRLQVCVALTPSLEKLNDKYNQMYMKWSKFRLNWFTERKLTGGSADNFSSCPLCFTRLGAPLPNQDNSPKKKDMKKKKKPKESMSQSMSALHKSKGNNIDSLNRGGNSHVFDESVATDQNQVQQKVITKHQINLPSISS